MDRRSDVFSLGVVMHELLTGAPLFDGDSIYAIARAVEHSRSAPVARARRELPLGLDAAVMNALDRDVARRTPTAAAFAEALEQVINIAGDETLERGRSASWRPARCATPLLAGIVAGKDTPRPIGRPTSSVTALGAEALVAPAQLPASEQPPQRDTPTHLPAPDEDEPLPARKSMALPIILALVLLAMVGGGIAMFAGKSKDTPRDARSSRSRMQRSTHRSSPRPAIRRRARCVRAERRADRCTHANRADAGVKTVQRDAAISVAVPIDARWSRLRRRASAS